MASDLDKVVLQYLQSRGYKHVAEQFESEVSSKNEEEKKEDPKTKGNTSNVKRKSPQEGSQEGDDIKRFAIRVGLNPENYTTNCVLFWGINEGNPNRYHAEYRELQRWIADSLETYKPELSVVSFPLFVHCYLELIEKKFVEDARHFYDSWYMEHMDHYADEVRALKLVQSPEHQGQGYAHHTVSQKFFVRMSTVSFNLLNTFLSNSNLLLLIFLLNQRVTVKVEDRPPFPQFTVAYLGSQKNAPSHIKKPLAAKRAIKWAAFPKKISKRAAVAKTTTTVPDTTASSSKIPATTTMTTTSGPSSSVPSASSTSSAVLTTSTTQGVGSAAPSSSAVPMVTTAMPTAASSSTSTTTTSTMMETTEPLLTEEEKMNLPNPSDPFLSHFYVKSFLRPLSAEYFSYLEQPLSASSIANALSPTALCSTFTNTQDMMTCVRHCHRATEVAVGLEDRSIRVFKLSQNRDSGEDGQEDVMTFRGHSRSVYSLSWDIETRFLLSGAGDGTVRLWDLVHRQNLVVYRGHKCPVWDVTFSPIGYYFASGAYDRTARLWSTDYGSPLRLFVGHQSDVTSVSFHPNGTYLASGSRDKTVRLWDIQSGNCVRIFGGHFGAIRTVSISPNGRYVVGGSEDRELRLWDIGSGKELLCMSGHEKSVYCTSFSSTGDVLASGGEDGSVRVWDLKRNLDSTSNVSDVVKPHKSFFTKNTPIYDVLFTEHNLLLVGGPFSLNRWEST